MAAAVICRSAELTGPCRRLRGGTSRVTARGDAPVGGHSPLTPSYRCGTRGSPRQGACPEPLGGVVGRAASELDHPCSVSRSLSLSCSQICPNCRM